MVDSITKLRYIKNINKLSEYGSKTANCGEYGIIKLDHSAYADMFNKRIFRVSKSKKIKNGGRYTFSTLRKAILAN